MVLSDAVAEACRRCDLLRAVQVQHSPATSAGQLGCQATLGKGVGVDLSGAVGTAERLVVDPATRLDGRARWAYETVMIVMALAVVALLPLEPEGWVQATNVAIWAVFVLDYGVRLSLSADRRGGSFGSSGSIWWRFCRWTSSAQLGCCG